MIVLKPYLLAFAAIAEGLPPSAWEMIQIHITFPSRTLAAGFGPKLTFLAPDAGTASASAQARTQIIAVVNRPKARCTALPGSGRVQKIPAESLVPGQARSPLLAENPADAG